MRIRQAQSYTSINLRKTEKNSTENVHTTHLLIFISILSQTKCQTLFIIRCRFIYFVLFICDIFTGVFDRLALVSCRKQNQKRVTVKLKSIDFDYDVSIETRRRIRSVRLWQNLI